MMQSFAVLGGECFTWLRAIRAMAVSLFVVTLSAGLCVAELNGPRPVDRQATLAVIALLKHDHLLKHPLDDEISERWIEQFIKAIDPKNTFFIQADVDELMRRKHDLDDLAKRGDVSFAYAAFSRLQKRIEQRVKLVDKLLAEPQDFTLDEELVTDPKQLRYAKDDAEVEEIWRRQVKYDLLMLKTEKIEGKEAADKLARRYRSFAKRMRQIGNDKLLEIYLSSLTNAYDPHTAYMSPSSQKNFEIVMQLKLEGIGVALRDVDGYPVVDQVMPGQAADKDGRLKPEDKIIGVAQGTSGEFVDVVDMDGDEVVKLIRGNRGTVVRLKVISAGQNEPKVIDITRANVELSDSAARSEIFEVSKKSNGAPYKIGVINLPSFYADMSAKAASDAKSATRDVARLLKEFNDKGIDACVMDLRNNGGGSLTEAINLTGLFIDAGPVVQVKDSDSRIQHFDDTNHGVAWGGPLVVLTNKFSASASEIFAGAIQDYNRGLIVGDTSTHGKGTVQSLTALGQQLFGAGNVPQLGALKITIQQFYRPSGDSTQNRGVLADIDLPSLTSQNDGESKLDYALAFDKVASIPHKHYNLVNHQMIDRLRSESTERLKASGEFNRELKKIASFNEQKKRKRVFLKEDKFMADRADVDTDEDEKKAEEQNRLNRPVVKRDYYFNEVLDTTVDYLGMLKTQGADTVGQRRKQKEQSAPAGKRDG